MASRAIVCQARVSELAEAKVHTAFEHMDTTAVQLVRGHMQGGALLLHRGAWVMQLDSHLVSSDFVSFVCHVAATLQVDAAACGRGRSIGVVLMPVLGPVWRVHLRRVRRIFTSACG